MPLEPEQLEELSIAVNDLTSVMKTFPSVLAGAMGNTTALGKAFAKASGEIDRLEEAKKKAQEEKQRREYQAETAYRNAINAISGFTSALLDSSADLKKYNSSVVSGFDSLAAASAISATKLGFAFAGIFTAAGKVAEQLLLYNARLVENYQSLSQFGIATGITSEEIAKLSRDAGFAGDSMKVFSKLSSQAGADLIALGGSFTDGMRMFGRFLDVGDKVRRQLNYLGVTTEEFATYQQQFLQTEIKAGLATGRGEEAMKKLTAASLELYGEMQKQAEITGMSVAKQMEERDYLSAIANFQVYNLKRLRDVERQESALGKEEVERRKERIKEEARLLLDSGTFLATTAGREVATSFIRRAATDGVGAMGERDVAAERLLNITQLVLEAKEAAAQGQSYVTQLEAKIPEAGNRLLDIVGGLTSIPPDAFDEILKQFGGSAEFLAYLTRNLGEVATQSNDTAQKEALRQRQIVEQGFQARLKEAEGITMAKDAALAYATTLYELERNAQAFIDQTAATVNKPALTLALAFIAPLAGLVALTYAAYKAAGALSSLPGILRGPGSPTGPTGPGAPVPDSTTIPDDDIKEETDDKGKKRYRDKQGRYRTEDDYKKQQETRKTRTPGRRGRVRLPGGKAGKILGGVGSIAGGLLVGEAADVAFESGNENVGTGLDILGNVMTGAGIGAAAGAPFAGVGAVPGAVAGGTLALMASLAALAYQNNKSKEEEITPTEIPTENLTEEQIEKLSGMSTMPVSQFKEIAESIGLDNKVVEQLLTKLNADNKAKEMVSEMSDAQLMAEMRLLQANQESFGKSHRSAAETQELISAYMSRIASAEEKAIFERNLQRASNKGEFTLAVGRDIATERSQLNEARADFTEQLVSTTLSIIDFKSASREATKNLRDIAGITLLDMMEEDKDKVSIDQSSIDALAAIMPRAMYPGAEGEVAKAPIDFSYRPNFQDLPEDIDAFLRLTREKESGGGRKLRVSDFANASTIGGQYGMGDDARREAFAKLNPDELKRLSTLGIKDAPKLEDLVTKDGAFKEGMNEVDDILAKSFARLTVNTLKAKLGRDPTAQDLRGAWWHGASTYSKIVEQAMENPDMLVSEFYQREASLANAQGKTYVMPDPAQFKGRTLKAQLNYISKQVGEIESYRAALPDRLPTNTDAFGQTPNVDPFALENLGQNLKNYNERRRQELGLPNVGNILGTTQTPNAAATIPGTSALVVSNTKDAPLITVDHMTNSSMTSLVDLNKIQTSELSSLNKQMNDLNIKIDVLNDIQKKLLERTSA